MARSYIARHSLRAPTRSGPVIRDFNGQQWPEGVGESHIENRTPTTPSVRCVRSASTTGQAVSAWRPTPMPNGAIVTNL